VKATQFNDLLKPSASTNATMSDKNSKRNEGIEGKEAITASKVAAQETGTASPMKENHSVPYNAKQQIAFPVARAGKMSGASQKGPAAKRPPSHLDLSPSLARRGGGPQEDHVRPGSWSVTNNQIVSSCPRRGQAKLSKLALETGRGNNRVPFTSPQPQRLPRGQSKLSKLSRLTGRQRQSRQTVTHQDEEGPRSSLGAASFDVKEMEEASASAKELGGLVEAHLVSGESFRDLPVAEEVLSKAATPTRRYRITCRALGFVFGILVLFIGIILLCVFLTRQEKDHEFDLSFDDKQTNYDLSFADLLPKYTIVALEDAKSPQRKAYDWLLADPSFSLFPDWRKLQRFALACLFYSLGGDGWSSKTGWLDYEHHECQWETFSYEKLMLAKDFFLTSFHPFENAVDESVIDQVYHDNPCYDRSLNDSSLDGEYRYLWHVGNNLDGTLPPELCLLTSLRSILLGLTRIHGALPATIGKLSELETISIMKTQMNDIPSEIGLLTNLKALMVIENEVGGTIASELGRLEKLQLLTLDHNVSTQSSFVQ